MPFALQYHAAKSASVAATPDAYVPHSDAALVLRSLSFSTQSLDLETAPYTSSASPALQAVAFVAQ